MDETAKTEVMRIELVSPAFEDGGMIPRQDTRDGRDISPELQWAAVPEGTESLALIMDDPDAPSGTFVHWVLYGLPPDRQELTENMPNDKTLPNEARQGVNDFGKIGYGGPCPPTGTHRYFFRLYALDTDLGLPPGESKASLLDAMGDHILAKGQIMGRYKRQRNH
jgi:Raf kinase inhibitor-like YbhB/YbcL family protein